MALMRLDLATTLSSSFEPWLTKDWQAVYCVFEFLKLNFCEFVRLDKAEPLKALLEKFITHRGTTAALEFHNLFFGDLTNFQP